MKLVVCCQICKNDIKLPYSAEDRGKLAAKIGIEVTLECPCCGKRFSYHINRVSAESGNLLFYAFLANLLLCVIILFALWDIGFGIRTKYLIPIALLIPNLIFIAVVQTDRRRRSMFNSYRL